jgi:glycosyltransferase involved in cell wall biosynthesis
MQTERANLAHIQHQYFFFGGVAPHKNHARAFLNALRIPAVLTAHEIAVPTQNQPYLLRRLIERANRDNFLHPSIRRIIVHTAQDRDRMIEIGVAPDRVKVLLHGIPTPKPLPSREQAQREFGVEGKRVLTLFGFLSRKKGHPLAIAALTHLPKDAVLLFAGDRHPDDHTDYVAGLHRLVAERKLQDRVLFAGYLPEERIPTVMAATDIALAPYLETSGSGSLALLMAYGLPIVASPIAPHRQIAEETPGSLALFAEMNAEALAATVSDLLQNASTRRKLCAAALAYADRHSYAQMARETVRVYEEILS